tara:strand:+ start:1050 stop:3689 length:2640 start_codon:yes stop_codon:yes gene_type:complete
MPHTLEHISEIDNLLDGLDIEAELDKITVEAEAKEAELKLAEQLRIKAEKAEAEKIENLQSPDTLRLEEDEGRITEEEDLTSDSEFILKVKKMPENAKNIFQSIMSFPSTVKKMYTGEDVEIEFPDIPEMGNMGGDAPGFLEGIIPSITATAVRDKFGKAEVLSNAWKGDKRWGGAFVDRFGHPMIMWKDKPYYVNKPGATETDFSQAVGEIVKYMPISKFVQKGNVLQRTVRGLIGYGAIETAQEGAENLITPEVTKAKAETLLDQAKTIGTMTGVAMAVDAVLPPVVKGVARSIRTAGKLVPTNQNLLKLFPELNITNENVRTSIYPLTQAQREAQGIFPTVNSATRAIKDEDIIRNSNLEGADILKGFDERVLDAIKADARTLQSEFGSGAYGDDVTSGARYSVDDQTGEIIEEIVPIESAERIKTIVQKEGEKLQDQASKIFQTIDESLDPPVFNEVGILSSSRDIVDYLESELGPDTMQSFKFATKWLGKFNDTIKKTSESSYFKETNFTDRGLRLSGESIGVKRSGNRTLSLRDADDRLKDLNNDITNSFKDGKATPETRILMGIKDRYQDFLYNGIDKGFANGDQLVLQQLKSAKDIYRKYLGISGKGTSAKSSDRQANAILAKIYDEGKTATDIVNSLTMTNALVFPSTMKLTLKRFKDNLPDDEYVEVMGLLKDTILQKAFSGRGKSGITRSNIVNNYNKIFLGNKEIINGLFTPAEVEIIGNFRKNVVPTLWSDPNLKLNKSGSGYTMFSAMNMFGLLSITKGLPIVSTVVGAMGKALPIEQAASKNEGMRAVSQWVERSSEPLLKFRSPSILGRTLETGVLTPSDISTVGREVSRPVVTDDQREAISPIFKNIDATTREKILAASNAT